MHFRDHTKVFETYWRFASERQNIFFRKLEGESAPWTEDPILAKYRFTNVYRVTDRVSQYLIREVIYKGEQSAQEIFFRTILFKLFNRIDTWGLLERRLASISYKDYSFKNYDRILTSALKKGERIYSAAYIMPSGKSSFGYCRKHRNHLKLLERMMEDGVPQRISEMRRMKVAFELLRRYPTIGDFLAYQFLIDINYSEMTDFSEMEFVVPGPGARDGIRKCFGRLEGRKESDIIRLVAERQVQEFEHRGLKFRTLWGRPLQLVDCQNLFCEVDKYTRVSNPGIEGRGRRRRIKQKYRLNPRGINYWFPPKWGLKEQAEIGSGGTTDGRRVKV